MAEFQKVESGKRSDRPEFTKASDYAELTNSILLVATDRNGSIGANRKTHVNFRFKIKGEVLKMARSGPIKFCSVLRLCANCGTFSMAANVTNRSKLD